jgi:hypothetical protein
MQRNTFLRSVIRHCLHQSLIRIYFNISVLALLLLLLLLLLVCVINRYIISFLWEGNFHHHHTAPFLQRCYFLLKFVLKNPVRWNKSLIDLIMANGDDDGFLPYTASKNISFTSLKSH